jgi:hypothetical protein
MQYVFCEVQTVLNIFRETSRVNETYPIWYAADTYTSISSTVQPN